MSDMSKTIQMSFFIQTHSWWNNLVYGSVVLISALIFLEPSSSAAITVCNEGWFNFSKTMGVCENNNHHSWIQPDWSPLTLMVELFTLAVFVSDVVMKSMYMKVNVYWTKKWHKVSGFFIILFTFDLVIFVFTYFITGSGIRFARPFRPLLLITRNRSLRRILETLLSMMNDLLRQLMVIIVYIVIFAWIGVILFNKTYRFTEACVDYKSAAVQSSLDADPDHCTANPCWNTSRNRFCICTSNSNMSCDDVSDEMSEDYLLPEDYNFLHNTFSNIFIAIVRLIVLISTENYPDVVLPAYKAGAYNMLYFVAFIFIGLFLLTSVLLAVIVEFWLRYLRKTNDTEKAKERLGITKAFTWIDEKRDYQIKEDSWNRLILLLRKDYTLVQSRFMFQLLDWEDKGHLDVLDFLHITELLKLDLQLRGVDLEFQRGSCVQFARKVINFRYTYVFKWFKRKCKKQCSDCKKDCNNKKECVRDCKDCKRERSWSISLSIAAFYVVILHTALAAVCTLQIGGSSKETIWAFNSALLTLILVEQGMRVLVSGRGYLSVLDKRWEVVTVTIAFISMLSYWVAKSVSPEEGPGQKIGDMFHVLWVVGLIMRPSILGNILVFFYQVMYVIAELFFFIIIVAYVFLGIGLELFSVMSDGDDDYYEPFQCGAGFRTAGCGVFTLFQLITSSNWHDVMNSVEKASGHWAYIYFCIFYFTINMVLLDLTIAMTIEMYNAIRKQYFNKKEDGENDQGIFFAVGTPAAIRATFTHPLYSTSSSANFRKRSSVGHRKVLQVIRSRSGNWRQSVVSNNNMVIPRAGLEEIQNAIEKEKVGHGEHKGQNYLDDARDDALNVKVIMDEKGNELRNRDKPECKVYLWAPVKDHTGSDVGELVMEIRDHHSHEATIKINLKNLGQREPVYAEVVNVTKLSEFYLNTITFTKNDSPDDKWAWHGTNRLSWSIKKQQRVQLRNDNIAVYVPLVSMGAEERVHDLAAYPEEDRLKAKIEGYKKARDRWDAKQKEINEFKVQFKEVSYLLENNAHRIFRELPLRTSRERTPSGEKSGSESEDTELAKECPSGRRIYVIGTDSVRDPQDTNRARERWDAIKIMDLNVMTRSLIRRKPPTLVRDKSIVKFMMHHNNPDSKKKLATLSRPPDRSRFSKSRSPSLSTPTDSSSSSSCGISDDEDEEDEDEEKKNSSKKDSTPGSVKKLMAAVFCGSRESLNRSSDDNKLSVPEGGKGRKLSGSSRSSISCLPISERVNSDEDEEEEEKEEEKPTASASSSPKKDLMGALRAKLPFQMTVTDPDGEDQQLSPSEGSRSERKGTSIGKMSPNGSSEEKQHLIEDDRHASRSRSRSSSPGEL